MNDLDLIADLEAQDDDGLGWSIPADAASLSGCSGPHTARWQSYQAQAVVRVVAVDEDGQIHLQIPPGLVAKNRHLLDRRVS